MERKDKREGGKEKRKQRVAGEGRWRSKEKGRDGKKAGDSKTAPLIRRLGSDVPIFQEQYR